MHSNEHEAQRRAEALFKKEQQLREGQKAMADYQAKLHAMREKTARLRALRLARDARNQGALSADQKDAPQLARQRVRPKKKSGPGSAGLNTTRRAQQHEDHINVLAMAVFVVVTISAARHAGQSSPPSRLQQISLLLRQYLAPSARCARGCFLPRGRHNPQSATDLLMPNASRA